MRHSGEIGIHTGVPATEALDAVSGVEILDVVTLAGRANEGTGSAAKAGRGEFLPLGCVKKFLGLVSTEGVCLQICQGKLLHTLADESLLLLHCGIVGILGQRSHSREKCLALFGLCIEIESILGAVANDVSLGICRVNAEGRAEAGLGRTGASHGNDHAVLAAVLIIGIYRIGEEDAIQDLKALDVASACAEDNEILTFASGVDDLDALSLYLEIHEVLGLGEEEILRAANGVERI